jgi:hypothetical protein
MMVNTGRREELSHNDFDFWCLSLVNSVQSSMLGKVINAVEDGVAVVPPTREHMHAPA